MSKSALLGFALFGIAAMLLTMAIKIGSAQIHVQSGQSIQTAIHSANNGETIIIHQGEYIENINFLGKSITLRSMDPTDQNVVENTIINGGYTESMFEEGIYPGSVVTFDSGETASSVLSGLTLLGGGAERGGGIYCASSSPHISHCKINENLALTPENGPESETLGGGIYCNTSSPTISHCMISLNVADRGGGVYALSSAPMIRESKFNENFSKLMDGAGVYCAQASTPNIINCSFTENHGHGVYCTDSMAKFVNCIFFGNLANGRFEQVCISMPSGTFCNGEIRRCSDDSRVHIRKYDQRSGRWHSLYRFFGKLCGTDAHAAYILISFFQ